MKKLYTESFDEIVTKRQLGNNCPIKEFKKDSVKLLPGDAAEITENVWVDSVLLGPQLDRSQRQPKRFFVRNLKNKFWNFLKQS